MLLIQTYTSASTIHGVGLFAAEQVQKGQMIWRFEPDFDRLIPDALLATLPGPARAFIDRYGFLSPQFPGGWVVSLDNSRFINHSPTPNTDNRKAETLAASDIAPGEEITCDYGEFCTEFRLD